TKADVNVDAPAEQAPAMAPHAHTDEENLPSRSNGAFVASSTIPSIYIQQFWDTIQYDKIHKFIQGPGVSTAFAYKEPVLEISQVQLLRGTTREVLWMPYPNELITDDIRGVQYYNAYLEKVAKHKRYLAGEEVSDPDSPAPKPAKATKLRKKKKSQAGSENHMSHHLQQNDPKRIGGEELRTKKSSLGWDSTSFGGGDQGMNLEISTLLECVGCREKGFVFYGQVTRGIRIRNVSLWTQDNLKLTVEESVIPEEPASSTRTLSSLQHLVKDFSFGDQFFNDKSSEADNEKTTADTEAESMVSVTIHQDTATQNNKQFPLPPQPQQSAIDSILIKRISELEQHMADLVQANLALEERMDKQGSRLYKLQNLDIPHQVSKVVDEIITDAVNWALQAPLRDRFRDLLEADMKEILTPHVVNLIPTKSRRITRNGYEYDKIAGCYKCQPDEQWFNITKDTFRDPLQITPVDNNNAFSSPLTTDALVKFVNDLRSFGASSIETISIMKKGCGKNSPNLSILSHKFHPRPESPLHLPTEEPVLGYLKFNAKGTKREVFGMPIPNELITDDIRGAQYYNAYLEKVAKHQRYLAGEEVSDPYSPAPKPAKATKQSNPLAPKGATMKPKPVPAKPKEKKRKLVTETSEATSPAKRSKAGKVAKKRMKKSSPRLVDEFVDEGVLENEPRIDSKEKSPAEHYIFQRRTPAPTEHSCHEESSSLYAELGLSDSDTESDKEMPPVVTSGAQDEGQAGPNPGIQDEGQAGPNPGDDAAPQPQ
ncbi:hypothetical protein Tco_1048318, partial [Tanacetum coccineum]